MNSKTRMNHTYRALGLGDVGLPEHVLVEAFLAELRLLRPGTVVQNLADSETEATAVVRAQEDLDLGDATARVRHFRRAVTIVLAALFVLPRAVERVPADTTHSLRPMELAVIRHLLHLANADVRVRENKTSFGRYGSVPFPCSGSAGSYRCWRLRSSREEFPGSRGRVSRGVAARPPPKPTEKRSCVSRISSCPSGAGMWLAPVVWTSK